MTAYLRPTNQSEALAALAQGRLTVLAGGTDYYPSKVGKPLSDDILDISAIAEMIGAKSGLGYMIWNAWEILSVDTMYVGLIMIAVIGYLFSLILNELERWIIPWKVER